MQLYIKLESSTEILQTPPNRLIPSQEWHHICHGSEKDTPPEMTNLPDSTTEYQAFSLESSRIV